MRGGVVEVGFDDNLPRARLTIVNSRACAAFATMSFVQTCSLLRVGLACTALALALGSQGCGSREARSFDEPAPAFVPRPRKQPPMRASRRPPTGSLPDAALDATLLPRRSRAARRRADAHDRAARLHASACDAGAVGERLPAAARRGRGRAREDAPGEGRLRRPLLLRATRRESGGQGRSPSGRARRVRARARLSARRDAREAGAVPRTRPSRCSTPGPRSTRRSRARMETSLSSTPGSRSSTPAISS